MMDVGVIGGGTMGVGIAYRFAVTGATVRVVEVDVSRAEEAVAKVAAVLDGGVARERLTAGEAADAAARLTPLGSVDEIPSDLHLIVESVFEDADVKRSVLEAAERRRPRILASNTSGLSIDLLATGLERPETFAGMHFFNPVWAIHLVEVVRGTATADQTVDAITGVVADLGMEAAVVNDSPGFASTRLGIVLGLEAIRMVEEGVAASEDIDRVMELGYRYPMGPLRTGDLVGLDVRLAIAEHLAAHYGERFEPPQLLRDMVAQGRLGKKTGRGFYEWD